MQVYVLTSGICFKSAIFGTFIPIFHSNGCGHAKNNRVLNTDEVKVLKTKQNPLESNIWERVNKAQTIPTTTAAAATTIYIYIYIYTSSIYPALPGQCQHENYRSHSNFGMVGPLFSFG